MAMNLTYRDLPRFLGREQRIFVVECILAAAVRQIKEAMAYESSNIETVFETVFETAGAALGNLAYQLGGHRLEDPLAREPTGHIGARRALDLAGGFYDAVVRDPRGVNIRTHAESFVDELWAIRARTRVHANERYTGVLRFQRSGVSVPSRCQGTLGWTRIQSRAVVPESE
jgi:hypothetical protein